MIDWYFVFTNSLWIFGLSIVLAAFSYHHWLASETRRRLREQFREPSWIMSFSAGMVLVGVGFGLSEGARWWERVIWLALAASFAWQGITGGYLKARSSKRPPLGNESPGKGL